MSDTENLQPQVDGTMALATLGLIVFSVIMFVCAVNVFGRWGAAFCVAFVGARLCVAKMTERSMRSRAIEAQQDDA